VTVAAALPIVAVALVAGYELYRRAYRTRGDRINLAAGNSVRVRANFSRWDDLDATPKQIKWLKHGEPGKVAKIHTGGKVSVAWPWATYELQRDEIEGCL
jgi:hypothetical protein